MSTIQNKLLPLIENVDYSIQNDELIALPKKRMVPQIIHHEAVAEVLDENGVVVSVEVPAFDETVQVEETYTEQVPTLNELKLSCVLDVALAVSEYLADKQNLVDRENDSINIVDNRIHSFTFANIPHPSIDELLACYEAAAAKNTQAAINDEARKYLADTDYLVIREIDSGVVCPVEVKQLRAAARLKII
jgi:hypothetical protein